MDFIERWFGIFPDSGEGFTEAFFIMAATGLVTASAGAIRAALERRRSATLKIALNARRTGSRTRLPQNR